MKKDPSAKATRRQFLKVARQLYSDLGLDYTENRVLLKKLFGRLLRVVPIHRSFKKDKHRKTMLDRIQDPKSSHYDTTPGLTLELSQLWLRHQKTMGRMGARQITRADRQWIHLTTLKRTIEPFAQQSGIPFSVCGRWAFEKAEQLALDYGKPAPYLTFVVAKIDEILVRIQKEREATITPAQQKIFDSYVDFRAIATDRKWKKEFVAGSPEHELVKRIETVLDEYGLTIRELMEIHFGAFAIHKSFPSLRDLVTDRAVDRIERSIKRSIGDVPITDEEEKYWKSISESSRSTSR